MAVCQVNSNGTVSLYHYYNPGGRSPSTLLSNSNPTVGFSNIVTSLKNGVAQCSFTRQNYLPDVNNYLDISNQYYILTAYGNLDSITS